MDPQSEKGLPKYWLTFLISPAEMAFLTLVELTAMDAMSWAGISSTEKS